MFELMRYPPLAATPAIYLTLLMAVGTLLPEVSHSFAHRHGGVHAEHAAASDVHPAPGERTAVSGDHPHDGHDHLALSPPLPGKSPLAYAVATEAMVRLLPYADTARRTPAAAVHTRASPESNHGPPPPTRAPPLV